MNKLHEKSPCCRAVIYKFGGKRRQCSLCKKTWTAWAKRRGRKPSRPNRNLLTKVLVEKRSLFTPGLSKKRITSAALSARFKKSLSSYLRNSGDAIISGGPLILVSDALWFQFNGKRWTLYLAVTRPTNDNKAVILEPMFLLGRENFKDWKKFFDAIPKNIQSRIKAVVSDGFRGIDRIAAEHNWILQRCHFHLIAQLQVNRGYWKKLFDSPMREEIYQTVTKLLVARNSKQILEEHLISLIEKPNCPRRLKIIASEFLRHLDQFRNYLTYPDLKLPATTNSVESLNKIIRSRCKHLRTPESLMLRIRVLLKIRKTMTCNPKIFQQN